MAKAPMLIHFISLDRTPDRCREFLARNKHLSHVSRFAAIDGNDLDLDALVRDGTISRGIRQIYSRGNLGLALSHTALWRRAIESGKAITVCEDDAIFNHGFSQAAERVISRLPPDWDLVLWGWNFDSVLLMDVLPGVSPCLVACDQEQMRIAVFQFQKQSLSPQPIKLLQAFGTVCYSISPKGARAFQKLCVPIPEIEVFFPALNRTLPNFDISVMMSNAYPRTNSFVSFPPVVITKNEREKSTTIPTL
jgi:GR25 family glycosyltransferase involved in LPS biosynthesis